MEETCIQVNRQGLTTDGMTGDYRTGDTKWDAYDVAVTDDDPDQLEIEFNTAWSPPKLYALHSES